MADTPDKANGAAEEAKVTDRPCAPRRAALLPRPCLRMTGDGPSNRPCSLPPPPPSLAPPPPLAPALASRASRA